MAASHCTDNARNAGERRFVAAELPARGVSWHPAPPGARQQTGFAGLQHCFESCVAAVERIGRSHRLLSALLTLCSHRPHDQLPVRIEVIEDVWLPSQTQGRSVAAASPQLCRGKSGEGIGRNYREGTRRHVGCQCADLAHPACMPNDDPVALAVEMHSQLDTHQNSPRDVATRQDRTASSAAVYIYIQRSWS